ncbi:chromatin binding protein-like protein [Schizosaccharomyces osmophilus]|uniref:Chromatin binding protein-like protein n=1 Tax=Schizosaccharomyces osmophilus TaxID=2545709 RepID=A0AAE9WBI7_9SCHI|nr:chromatin binding protein-like protein [Schizosaccharomyces osmophilus]WBW72207.1 chromatin binding protein-like protein [Schizosaccharomyces osmophilus]
MKIERSVRLLVKSLLFVYLFSVIIQDNGVLARKVPKQQENLVQSVYNHHVRPLGTAVHSQFAKATPPLFDGAKQARDDVKSYYDKHAKPSLDNFHDNMKKSGYFEIPKNLESYGKQTWEAISNVKNNQKLHKLCVDVKTRTSITYTEIVVPATEKFIAQIQIYAKWISEKVYELWINYIIPNYQHYKPIVRKKSIDGYMEFRYVILPYLNSSFWQMINVLSYNLTSFWNMHMRPQLQHIYESVLHENSENYASSTTAKMVSDISSSMLSTPVASTTANPINKLAIEQTITPSYPEDIVSSSKTVGPEYDQRSCISNTFAHLSQEFDSIESEFGNNIEEQWKQSFHNTNEYFSKELKSFEELSNLRVLAIENSLGNLVFRAQTLGYDDAVTELLAGVKKAILNTHERAVELRNLAEILQKDIVDRVESSADFIRNQTYSSFQVAVAACNGNIHDDDEKVRELTPVLDKVHRFMDSTVKDMNTKQSSLMEQRKRQYLSRIGSIASDTIRRLTAIKNSHKVKINSNIDTELYEVEPTLADQTQKIIEINAEHAHCDDISLGTASYELHEAVTGVPSPVADKKHLNAEVSHSSKQNDVPTSSPIKVPGDDTVSQSIVEESIPTLSVRDTRKDEENVYSILPIQYDEKEQAKAVPTPSAGSQEKEEPESVYSILPIEYDEKEQENVLSTVSDESKAKHHGHPTGSAQDKKDEEQVYSILPVEVDEKDVEQFSSDFSINSGTPTSKTGYATVPVEVPEESVTDNSNKFDAEHRFD